MKHLSLSKDGQRLTLVIPAQLPLKAAAKAIRGARFEGIDADLAVYSYPVEADVAEAIRDTFAPDVSADAQATVDRLLDRAAAVAQAVADKGTTQLLSFDPYLCREPRAHQVEAMNFCASLFKAGERGAALLMEQGTGKSLVGIGMAHYLWRRGLINWAMVLCPNHLRGTWGDAEDGELVLNCKHDPTMVALRGSREERVDQLAELMATRARSSHQLLWVITNYDQLSVDSRGVRNRRQAQTFRDLLAAVKGGPPGLLIADESTAVKNPSAKRTDAAMQLARAFTWRMFLTGTLVTKSPLDTWSQFELLGDAALGFSTYMQFDRTYATRQRRRLQAGGAFYELVEYKNLDDLERRVARLSYRVLAKDCLDLPPVTVRPIPVTLLPAQAKALRQLKSDAMAVVEDGLVDGRNILTRYMRMGQIVGGFVPIIGADGSKQGVHEFTPNPKLRTLVDYLSDVMDDPDRKVVVFCKHTAEILAITKECKRWGAVPFYGGIKPTEREDNRKRFSTDPACRLFVAQYQCASTGLNLTSADTLVFYSLTFSYGDFAQARKRVHRMGQTRHVTEVYLLGQVEKRGGKLADTLDKVVLSALRDKRNLADIVMGDRARRTMEAL